MLVSEFDYELPAELIAQHPRPRGDSRLLLLPRTGEPDHRRIGDLPALLTPGDLLVVNDTRVLPARLFGRRRPGGGRVELLLAERHSDTEWSALVRPGRRARPGTRIELTPELEAEVTSRGTDGRHRIRFSTPIEPHLDEIGHVPLPPYIRRPDEPSDRDRYQTVYARHPGAIAAPTAGLHLTRALLDDVRAAGVQVASLTLHVGLGTFKPVTAELVHEHRMDSERYSIPAATANAIQDTRDREGRIVAVGTTTVRALESAATEDGRVDPRDGSTGLFIVPGYRFRIVDLLLTNFHLPRSTLLMLVCAFAGHEHVLAAYEEAIRRRYLFYSYGDAMLVERGADLEA